MPTVLIVEDERISALALKKVLMHRGFDIAGTASDSVSALQIFRASAVDMVIMDVRLEGSVDGIETARIMQQERGVPVLFITANSDRQTVERAEGVRPVAVLSKPVNFEKVVEIVHKALRS